MLATTTLVLLPIAVAGLVAAARAARTIGRWRVGRPAEAAGSGLLAGLAASPRRYLDDVHFVVAREPRSARMHAALAGGMLVAVAATVATAISDGPARATFAGVVAAASLLATAGLVLQRRRRHPAPPRLSGGAWARLTSLFAGALLYFLAVAVAMLVAGDPGPLVVAVPSAIGTIALGRLAHGLAGGPMRHALAGAIHLVRHPRPLRFGGARPGGATGPADPALRSIDLDAERLGAATIADFPWPRLASFDACVQCGRCESLCPAFAAGLPLSPKRLIQDLSLALDPAGTASTWAGAAHPGRPLPERSAGPDAALILSADAVPGTAGIAPDTLWACTTCRACVEECPMTIEHVDAVVALRRHQTLERGALPPRAADALENLRKTDTGSGRATAERLDWATDLALPRIEPGRPVDMLLWLGESAFERRNQSALRAFVRLLRRAGCDFAVLAEERDTGDLARRLGDEATFARLARANVAALAPLAFRRIVTMDPHVFHVLAREYPEFGGHWRVEHHTMVLDDLLAADRLVPTRRPDGLLTYHDPCYLGRYGGVFEAPRRVLTRLGAATVEMEHAGRRSRCCGGGGGALVTDVAGERRISDVRMDEARAVGATRVVAACPFCTQMLESVAGARPAVGDLAELVLEAVEDTP